MHVLLSAVTKARLISLSGSCVRVRCADTDDGQSGWFVSALALQATMLSRPQTYEAVMAGSNTSETKALNVEIYGSLALANVRASACGQCYMGSGPDVPYIRHVATSM